LKKDIPDPRPLADEQRAMLVEFVRLLDLKCYADMARDNPHKERLRELEAELGRCMGRQMRTDVPLTTIPTNVFVEFLVAYGLEDSLSLTVGEGDELASSCLDAEQLSELSAFRLRQVGLEVRTKTLSSMAAVYGLREDEFALVLYAIDQAKVKLNRRRAVVSALRRSLFIDNEFTDRTAKRAFDRMYPNNPLKEGEVGVVLTATALYWRLRPKDMLDKTDRSPTEIEEAKRFIERLTGFRTANFRQFPAFHGYDVRNSDARLIDSVCALSGLDYVEVCDMIKRSVWIEATADIRLYIIHDTWGHVWQGDFSCLEEFYEAAHFAFIPLTKVLPCKIGGRIIARQDLVGGSELVPNCVDERLLEWVLGERLRELAHLIVTPIMAELMADIAEYKFCVDAELSSPPIAPLPSSSLFGYHPAKMDFGWVSPYFFGGKFCAALRDGVVELMGEEKARAFITSSHLPLDGLSIDRLKSTSECHSSLEQLFIQLIRIFASVNECYGKRDQACRENISGIGALFMITMARIFCLNPGRQFWQMDVHVAESIPTLVQWAVTTEASLADSDHDGCLARQILND
jgi:hypothetical protein